MKRILITLFAAFLFGVGTVSAQDIPFATNTPQAAPTQAAGEEAQPVGVVAPIPAVVEEPDASTETWWDKLTPEHLIIFVQAIIIVVLAVRTGNLIPPSVMTVVISEFRAIANKTITPIDNVAVDMLEAVAKPITAPAAATPDKTVGFVSPSYGGSGASVTVAKNNGEYQIISPLVGTGTLTAASSSMGFFGTPPDDEPQPEIA